jgi:predicted HicB family RNase H-like nuclease
MDTLKFKGYEGTVELDQERGVCRGKVLLANDLVTYEATTLADLRSEFEAAVDDYLETCRALGRSPSVAFNDQLNQVGETPT